MVKGSVFVVRTAAVRASAVDVLGNVVVGVEGHGVEPSAYTYTALGVIEVTAVNEMIAVVAAVPVGKTRHG